MKKKLISASLSAMLALSALPVMADATDDTVYSYTDENGQLVEITQADLDEGHWNKEALGNSSPEVYTDFPAKISSYVDEFTNLSVYVDYLKTLTGADSALLEVSNIFTNEIVYSDDLTDGYAEFDNTDINTDYKFTITETINGETNVYYKAVVTSWNVVDMPEEIINGTTESESIILVGDIEDLRASTKIDENGMEYCDTSMPRYTQVKACDFKDYILQLDHSNTYRVYTGEGGNANSGFIIDASGEVKNPGITVTTLEGYNAPSVLSTASVTASNILQATNKINLFGYRDACFKQNDGSTEASKLMVATYTIPEEYSGDNDSFIFTMTSNRSVTWQIWVSTLTDENYYNNYNNNTHIYSSYNNPKRLKAAANSGSGEFSFTFLRNTYKNNMNQKSLREGDKLYFVAYFPDNVGGMAYMTCRSKDYALDTDETVSFDLMSEAYESADSLSSLAETNCTLKNTDDVDVFYVNDERATRQYKLQVTNKRHNNRTSHIKDVQLVRVRKTAGYVYTELSDVVTVPQVTDSSSQTKGFSFSTSSSYHYGVYIYTAYRGYFTNDPYTISYTY